jgi:hypothetical protein
MRMKISRTTLGMPSVVQPIAQRHDLDLGRVGSRLVLDNPPWPPLAIRVVDDSVVEVAHLSGESVNSPTDPEATYWTAFLGYVAPGVRHPWVPLSLARPVGQHTICGLVLGGELVLAVPHLQVELASFADGWAEQLEERRYLEDGAVRLLQHEEEDEG